MSDGPFYAIGIDVGGTKIAAGLVEFPSAAVLSSRIIPTRPERGGNAVFEETCRLGRELAAEAAQRSIEVQALGLALCELVDQTGRIASANCLDWRHLPVRERLSESAPAWIEADVRAAALAEACFGAGQQCDSLLYVTIGTGIASCLVLEQQPYLGARGLTGTMASSPASSVCLGCGRTVGVSLEEFAAGPAIAARFAQASGGPEVATVAVLEMAEAGDAVARAVVQSAGAAMGAGIAHLVNVLDPAAVVIGGGLGLAEGLYRQSLELECRRLIWSEAHRDLPIRPARTGIHAALIGAAAAAWQRLSRPVNPRPAFPTPP